MAGYENQLEYYKVATLHLRELHQKQQLLIDRLHSFLFEVCESDCPQHYREIVLKEILKPQNTDEFSRKTNQDSDGFKSA